MFNQKGAIPLLVLLAIIGVISFFALVSFSPFKDATLQTLYPKDQSQAATPNTFLETFDEDAKNPDGTFVPHAPTPWQQTNWAKRFDVMALDTDSYYRDANWDQLDPITVTHHGPNCEPPLNVHTSNNIYDAIFNCRNHIMTSILSGYAAVWMTPNHLVDFSQGEAVITWDVSTFQATGRDWWDLFITPWEDNLAQPLSICCNGVPDRAVQMTMDGENMRTVTYVNHQSTSNTWGGSIGEGMSQHFPTKYSDAQAAAATRQTYEFRISKTHVKFSMPKLGLVFVDKDIPPLNWDKGVVQWGHHAYNPQKGCTPDGTPTGCAPNTWHWDNFGITPSQPFTMIKGDQLGINKYTTSTVNFPNSAPASSYLRFSGVGTFQVSYDNGATYVTPQKHLASQDAGEHFSTYFTPVPQGTSKVIFKGSGGINGRWLARNPQIWSQVSLDPNATPIPLPSSTPTPQPTSAPTPTPNPNGTVISTIEAESGTVTAPFTVSNGLVSQSIDSQSNPLNGGKLTIPFNTPVAGDYLIKGFVNAADSTKDSLFVNVDQEPTLAMIWDLIPTSGIQQRTVSWRDLANPKVFTLTAGSHSIIIRGREPDAQIDKVVIEKLGAPPPSVAPSPTPSSKVGDLNNDNAVNAMDFAVLLSKWGSADSTADLNGDGSVGLVDFSILLSKWGT